MSSYSLAAQPRVRCGAGAHRELAASLPAETASVFLVLDAGLQGTGIPDQIAGALPAGTHLTTGLVPGHEPTVESVDALAEQARGLSEPVIVGVGGGTALDTAKLVAALQPVPGSVDRYLLTADALPARQPSVMIPTTAGTGSEATRTAIVKDSAGRKAWIFGDRLLPDAIVLDPGLTIELPPHITRATGIDAFVHGLEAATAQAANSFSRAAGLEAVRLTRAYLGRAAADGADLAARQGMLEAATLAGIAIDRAGTGLAHNIGHALGALYQVPHGVAVALGLHASIDWSVAHAGDVFAPAARAMADGAVAAELPELYRQWLRALGSDWLAWGLGTATLDADALARAMRTQETAPMADNNAARPDAAALTRLATATVASCEACAARSPAVGA